MKVKNIMSLWKPRYYDIGVNFSDLMFQGRYHHSPVPKHPPDLEAVIKRAHLFNVKRMLITASTIKESADHFDLCDKYPGDFHSTAGVHPCTVAEEFYVGSGEDATISPELDAKLDQLKQLVVKGAQRGTVKAFGEIGLDYDRLHYSTKTQQISMFKKQLELIASLKHLEMPLFLHMRNACDDFVDILEPFIQEGSIQRGNGVVHSFTGTKEELQKVLKLGFYVSVNGCSLKTQENLDVAKLIPKDKLMIETDAPWCEVRKSHAGYKYLTAYPNKFYPEIGVENSFDTKKVSIKLDELLPFPSIKKENYEKHRQALESLKSSTGIDSSPVGVLAPPLIKSRNEPVTVGQVAQIMCTLHGLTEDAEIEDFLDTVYSNSCKLFKVDP